MLRDSNIEMLCVENIDDLRLLGGVDNVYVEHINIEFIKCVDTVNLTRCKSQSEIEEFVYNTGVIMTYND